MGEAVDRGLLFPPVEFIYPVSAQFLHITKRGAVSPATVIWHFVPGVIHDLRANLLQGFIRNVYSKRLDHDRVSN